MSSPRFIFTKRFAAGVSAAQLTERTLNMWTPSNAMHAHIFPVYAHSELRLLQRVDDRNLIVLQTLAMSDRGVSPSSSLADATLTPASGESGSNSIDLQRHMLLSELNAAPGTPTDTRSSSSSSVGQKLTRAVLHVAMVGRGEGQRVFFTRSIPPIHYELSRASTTTVEPASSNNPEWVELFNWYATRQFSSLVAVRLTH